VLQAVAAGRPRVAVAPGEGVPRPHRRAEALTQSSGGVREPAPEARVPCIASRADRAKLQEISSVSPEVGRMARKPSEGRPAPPPVLRCTGRRVALQRCDATLCCKALQRYWREGKLPRQARGPKRRARRAVALTDHAAGRSAACFGMPSVARVFPPHVESDMKYMQTLKSSTTGDQRWQTHRSRQTASRYTGRR
jgi:hypothetical protein